MHASKRSVALRRHQPDPEAGRGAGDAQVPKNNGMGAPAIIPARPRTVRAEVELAPFPTIEGLERPIEKVFCSAGGKSEAESCNLQLEREIILNRRARFKDALSRTTNSKFVYIRINDARPYIR